MEEGLKRIEVVELLSYIGHELRGILQLMNLGGGAFSSTIREEIRPAYERIEKLLKKVEEVSSLKKPRTERLNLKNLIKDYFPIIDGDAGDVDADKSMLSYSFSTLSQFLGDKSRVEIEQGELGISVIIHPERDFKLSRVEIMESIYPSPLFPLRCALRIFERHGWTWHIKDGNLVLNIFE
ncbi:hypothetical protein DRQ23_06085 [bacterium]|nr:MAG: hypothetical protein DRQ23_06085 [bacterium]